MPRPQTNRSAISAAMEKGRIADSSEETATSDKAHRSVVLRPTRSTKAAAAMFPTSMPRAVTDMKAALRPALEAPECSQRPKSTPAMDKSKKSKTNANRNKSDHLRRKRPDDQPRTEKPRVGKEVV